MGLAQRIGERIRGKAISHRPDLAGRVHVYSSGGQGEAFPDMDSFVGWASVYESYIWLRKGLRFIADSIKFLPLMVVDDPSGEEIKGHQLMELMNYVNDSETQADLWQKYVIYKYLGGEFFLEIVPDNRGNPVEVWARRPDKMIVVPDVSPERRLYPRIAGYRNDDDRDHLIPSELMWFDKFTHPTNQWRGLNVIKAAREGISIDVFAHGSIKTFLKQGARPDYAVIAPAGLTATEHDKITDTLMRKFSGWDKVNKPIVLEEGVTDVKPLSFPPKDIQWMENSKFGRDEVAAILNMPDLLMGFGAEQYDNSDKMRAHMLYYWLMNGMPLLRSRDVSMTNFFHQYYPRLLPLNQRIVTDTSEIDVLQENYAEKLDQANKLFVMGVPFEQINERLKLGIDYTPPVMADASEKAAELERFRRWAKKRNGKPIDVAQFQSDILTHEDKVGALGDASAVMPPFQLADYPLRPAR